MIMLFLTSVFQGRIAMNYIKKIRKIGNKVNVCFLSASEIYDPSLKRVSSRLQSVLIVILFQNQLNYIV